MMHVVRMLQLPEGVANLRFKFRPDELEQAQADRQASDIEVCP